MCKNYAQPCAHVCERTPEVQAEGPGRRSRDRGRKKRSLEFIAAASLAVLAVVLLVTAAILHYAPPGTEQGEGVEDNKGPTLKKDGGDGPGGGEQQPPVGAQVGNMASDLSLTDLDGRPFSLSGFQGKAVLIDLMATWCGPCKEAMPDLRGLYGNPSCSKDVAILSIDVDDSESTGQLRGFRDAYRGDWTFAAHGGEVGTAYGASSIPAVYIIDVNGAVSYKTVGVTPVETLRAELDGAI